MKEKKETYEDVLSRLATTNTSTDRDSAIMESLLHKMNFPRARVVIGTVYLEGKGTLTCPPYDIHACAKMLLPYLHRLTNEQ